MPIYEYSCAGCGKRVEILFKSFSQLETTSPQCPKCGDTSLTRLVSRVTIMRSWGSDLLDSGFDGLDGVDENDSDAMMDWMHHSRRHMGDDSGQLSEMDMLDLGIDSHDHESHDHHAF